MMQKKNVSNSYHSHSSVDNSSSSQLNSYIPLFESLADAVLIINADYTHVYSNLALCRMLGYSQQEVMGKQLSDIFMEREPSSIRSALATLRTQPNYFGEWDLKCKDGSIIQADITVTVMPDGNLIGMARDITLQKKQADKIKQLSRLYASLAKINQTIIWLPSRSQLFDSLCKTLVNDAGFKLAWVSWVEQKPQRPVPVAAADTQNTDILALFSKLKNSPIAEKVFNHGKPCVINDLFQQASPPQYIQALANQDFASLAAFPILFDGQILGVLSVYAEQPNFFLAEELSLLEGCVVNITFALENIAREEKRQAAEIIAQNEKKLSDTMFSSMPGVYYLFNDQGKFIRWNNHFQTASGYTGEEIGEMNPIDFFPVEQQATITEKIKEAFVEGQSFAEAHLLTKSGEKVPYLFTGKNMVFDGENCVIGMGIDLSLHKKTASKLIAVQQNFQELVESANSIILRWNAEGVITFLNTFGQQFFGYQTDEIVGKHVVGTIVPNTDSAGKNLQDLMEKICVDTKAFEQNVNENIRKDGERVWVSWTNKVVLNPQGELVEILSIGNDITERLNAEQKIKDLNTNLEKRVAERTIELEKAMVRAESADKLKSAFLATMSHELRTPLNSIIGFTGLILQQIPGPINAEQSKQLGMVKTSARHLLDLINDVLDISKIEAGQLEINRDWINILDVINEVVTLLSPLAEKKNLSLIYEVHQSVNEAYIDSKRLKQVLINLGNNAIKFTEEGSVTILVESMSADHLNNTSAIISIKVIDSGIGIKPDDINLLFEPFRQVDIGLSRKHEGTGLGLAICKKLVDLMGGSISVTSKWQEGSAFHVSLPVMLRSDYDKKNLIN